MAPPEPEPAAAEEDFNPYAEPAKKAEPAVSQVQKLIQSVDTVDKTILSEVDTLKNQEKSKEMLEKYKTLIRITIEFCVTIQDCFFLFYDLFLMFQEENLESTFLDELKPFIMAGRFQNWNLPIDILENQILGHIKASNTPDTVEKVIINLSLKECPKELMQELIEYCEENCLSSGLLYLHTSVDHSEEEA